MTGSQHEVLIVRYGARTTTRSDVFLNYHAYGEPDGPMEMDYFFWVIQGDAGPVVVDTGFSRDAGRASAGGPRGGFAGRSPPGPRGRPARC